MRTGHGAVMRPWLPTLAVLAALLLFAALWLGGPHDAYFGLFRLLGVPAFRFPFLDTHGELAVIDCHRRGLDVYLSNPCDALGRVHVYTPLWYRFDILPVTTADTPVVGFALAVLFALSLRLLPRSGAGIVTIAALSPAVAFAMERGNADLLMFVLAALAGWLAARRTRWRFLAYPLVVLAACLKLYPATLVVYALRERGKTCVLAGGFSLLVLAAYLLFDRAGIREMLAVLGAPAMAPIAQAAVGLAAVGIVLRCRPALRDAVAVLTEPELVFLLAGAALVVGCFVLGQSGEYRAVHLLFVLPAFVAMASVPGGPGRLAKFTAGIVLIQLWGDLASGVLDVMAGVAPGGAATSALARLLWAARELAWWWIVVLLVGVALAAMPRLPALRGGR